ncbi:hypothetical protein TNCV_4649961, partial [Trichonephila clavipes]
AGWADRRIARHMGRSDAYITRFSQEWVDNGRFSPRTTADRRHTYNTAVRQRHSENCFAIVPLAAPWIYGLSNTSLTSQIIRTLFNLACLRYDGKATASRGNVDDLAIQLERTCQEKLKGTIKVPYHSVPRRIAACIQTRGY